MKRSAGDKAKNGRGEVYGKKFVATTENARF
jgi:hypothetical protein